MLSIERLPYRRSGRSVRWDRNELYGAMGRLPLPYRTPDVLLASLRTLAVADAVGLARSRAAELHTGRDNWSVAVLPAICACCRSKPRE